MLESRERMTRLTLANGIHVRSRELIIRLALANDIHVG
jgi:hypothetical protein